jgi:hypothetical protein
MQNSTSFDLSRALKDWRARVASSPAFRGEKVNELESHLRDSISRLQAGGLSEEESWVIAQRRLGQIDSLEQEFAKLSLNSTHPSSRRSARLVRSFSAIGAGVMVAILFSFLGEWSALQSLLENDRPDTLNEERFQDFSNFTQFAVLSVLMAAVVGGSITALIAQRDPVKHALAASALLWGSVTILRGLYVPSWLLWLMTGAAMTTAMILGALLCERHRPRWKTSTLTEGDWRRFSRRAGISSVLCMVVAIIVGFAGRFTTNSISDSLHALMSWLILGALATGLLALVSATVRKTKMRKPARLA